MASRVWNDIVSKALSLHMRFLSDGSCAWYRGHRDATWQLKSTIHRHVQRYMQEMKVVWPEERQIALLRDEYKAIYRRFRSEAWPLLPPSERSEWGVLFTMQHYSIPTRLLDWSESFACAVFFAQLNRSPGDTAAIWVLDPAAVNQIAIERYGLVALDETASGDANIDVRSWHPQWVAPPTELQSIAAVPIYTNPRMVPQRSRFTLMGDDFLSLDQQWSSKLVCDDRLVQISLPPETFEDASDSLSVGTSDSSIAKSFGNNRSICPSQCRAAIG